MERARFTRLWQRTLDNGTSSDADEVFEKIAALYAQPHRRYHTARHIDHCLAQFDSAATLMKDEDAVEMALWFHDAIYEIPSTENERRSAEMFVDLTRGRVSASFAQNVYDMILITVHQVPATRPDDKYVVDIDLSSFALPWDEFKRDSDAVRAEHTHLDDREFYQAHTKFMQNLLARPHFFATDFFRNRYESSARGNLERLIRELESAGLA